MRATKLFSAGEKNYSGVFSMIDVMDRLRMQGGDGKDMWTV